MKLFNNSGRRRESAISSQVEALFSLHSRAMELKKAKKLDRKSDL